jgi:hypothetical protein
VIFAAPPHGVPATSLLAAIHVANRNFNVMLESNLYKGAGAGFCAQGRRRCFWHIIFGAVFSCY